MREVLWQTSQDGVVWVDMKTPQEYSSPDEDLDNDSYRSVITGALVRNRIAKGMLKLEISYPAITKEEIKQIATCIKTNQEFWVRCECPQYGYIANPYDSSDISWVMFKAYCSKGSPKKVLGTDRYTWSFNIIQTAPSDFNK